MCGAENMWHCSDWGLGWKCRDGRRLEWVAAPQPSPYVIVPSPSSKVTSRPTLPPNLDRARLGLRPSWTALDLDSARPGPRPTESAK